MSKGSDLCDAARNGKLTKMRQILDSGEVNLVHEEGGAALSQAVAWGQREIVVELLRRGVDPNGKAALHTACFSGASVAIVRELLKYRAKPNLKKDGEMPLHVLCSKINELNGDKSRKVVRLLLKHRANPNGRDNHGATALHRLFWFSKEKGACSQIATDLIRHPQINIELRDEEGYTPLACSLIYQHFGISRQLIQRGAKVTNIDNKGGTVLHLAMAGTFQSDSTTEIYDFVADVLSKGIIDIDHVDRDGETALFRAVQGSCCKELAPLLQYLIEKGASATLASRSGATVLHQLCRHSARQRHSCKKPDSFVSAVSALLSGKDAYGTINSTDMNGNTPLHILIESGSNKLAMAFLQEFEGIDLNKKKCPWMWTPLHIACSILSRGTAHLKVIKMLMERGANINDKDAEGNTPLHLACRNFARHSLAGSWNVVSLLMDQGGLISANELNTQGLNPFMVAAQSNAPIDFLFMMLQYTGGTVLNCTGKCSQHTTAEEDSKSTTRKRSHSSTFGQCNQA